jgi:NAD(P)-dependent dehydrogenase (short-subunit alcohol dehydrogenase family)
MAAYAASKAGLIGLTQVLAAEYGAQGVRVNALLPGGTDTPMGRAFTDTPESLAFVQQSMPSNGWPNRRRSPARPSIWRPMHPALPPALLCWPMVGYLFVAHDLVAPRSCDRNLIVRAPYV